MISICVYLLFACYALTEGVCHALLYHMRDHAKKMPVKKEHVIFNAMRCVMMMAYIIVLHDMSFTRLLIMLVALLLVFSFYHNGMYHECRKRFSYGAVYPEGWMSDPDKTSTARFNMNNDLRTVLAIGGTVLYFCAVLYP